MRLRTVLAPAVLVAVGVIVGVVYNVRHRAPVQITTAPVTIARVQRDILTTGTLEPTRICGFTGP